MMGNEQRVGIYNKFTVTRNDGGSAPGKKHGPSPASPLGCAYFVLDLTHDPYAKPAILAYAAACEKTHPVLAADLRKAAETYPFKGGRT